MKPILRNFVVKKKNPIRKDKFVYECSCIYNYDPFCENYQVIVWYPKSKCFASTVSEMYLKVFSRRLIIKNIATNTKMFFVDPMLRTDKLGNEFYEYRSIVNDKRLILRIFNE